MVCNEIRYVATFLQVDTNCMSESDSENTKHEKTAEKDNNYSLQPQKQQPQNQQQRQKERN